MAQKLDQAGIQQRLDGSPFIGVLGLTVEKIDHENGVLALRMASRPHLERRPGSGQFHGGAIASLIDIAGDFAIGMLVGEGVPTMNLRVDYLRPAAGSHLDAIATLRKQGRATAVVDIDVISGDGKLVAIGRGTWVPLAG